MPEQLDIIKRPRIGALYTPGGGAIAELRAIGPTHVVVHWARHGGQRHVIYTREDFDRQFVEVPRETFQQFDLFAEC